MWMFGLSDLLTWLTGLKCGKVKLVNLLDWSSYYLLQDCPQLFAPAPVPRSLHIQVHPISKRPGKLRSYSQFVRFSSGPLFLTYIPAAFITTLTLYPSGPEFPRILPYKVLGFLPGHSAYPRRQNCHQRLALISSSEGGSAGVIFSVSWWIIALRNEISSFFMAMASLRLSTSWWRIAASAEAWSCEDLASLASDLSWSSRDLAASRSRFSWFSSLLVWVSSLHLWSASDLAWSRSFIVWSSSDLSWCR